MARCASAPPWWEVFVTPCVMTIAGHDPSNGAGLGADLKVFEAWGVHGLSVCTALTVQNESQFMEPGWLTWEQALAQLEGLWRVHRPHWFKIGLVQNAEMLSHIVQWIRKKDPAAFILWDPILKASAGFDFHSSADRQSFVDICSQLSLITPNALEAEWLGAGVACPMLIKGGHQQGELCEDSLWLRGHKMESFVQARLPGSSKHGTGCVLSASITALMARGFRLERACQVSRQLLQDYHQSTSTKLGLLHSSLFTDIAVSNPLDSRLYAITWDGSKRSHAEQVSALCEAGLNLIQLRMKQGSPEDRLRIGWECLRIARNWGATLVINDDVELARAIHAPAVHLGLHDMSVSDARKRLGAQVLIGGTANTPEHVQKRIEEGADYVGLGPWRFTGTKENLSPVLGEIGVEAALRLAKSLRTNFPVYVIGGIQPTDCKEILDLGARGVAVSSALVEAQSVTNKVNEFRLAMAGQGRL